MYDKELCFFINDFHPIGIGERVEETFEEAQCPKALDARQAWRSFCK